MTPTPSLSSTPRTASRPREDILLPMILAGAMLLGAAPPAENRPGLFVSDGQLMRFDPEPAACSYAGVNTPDLFLDALRAGEDTAYRKQLHKLREGNTVFVRFKAGGDQAADWRFYREHRNKYFEVLDDIVRTAEKVGMGLIPCLFWRPEAVSAFVDEAPAEWGNPDSRTIAFMREYTQAVVQRYAASHAILLWEFADAFNLEADKARKARRGDVIAALREFGSAVRKDDPHRAIGTGNAFPRAATREQVIRDLLAFTPDPCDMISIQLEPADTKGQFKPGDTCYEELLEICWQAARQCGKGLYAAQFGAVADGSLRGLDWARQENHALFNALERCDVPLVACQYFTLPELENHLSLSPYALDTYLLFAINWSNQRRRLYQSGLHKADLEGGGLSGRLLDNLANGGRDGSGFNPLYHARFPGENLFGGDAVGMNFELVYTGNAEADEQFPSLTPRTDPCSLALHSAASASLRWAAKGSSWGLECEMLYTFAGNNAIDMTFHVTPTEERFPMGYVGLMWASYMNHTRGREIHFYGTDGEREGWMSFGERTQTWFESGAIAHYGAPALSYEPGSNMNAPVHAEKRFLLPFYYGLVDGDGDHATQDDTMLYLMMFDQRDAIRLAMWNFTKDASGQVNPHSPAWDWHYVIRKPAIGQRYGYRARLVYKPFVSAEDAREEYVRWAKAIGVAAGPTQTAPPNETTSPGGCFGRAP